MKLGLRDDRAAIIRQRKIDSGMASLPIETFFDLIEYDEGRDPQRDRPWEKV
jgi:gluconokinase